MWIHFIMGIICGVMGIIVFALSYPLYLRNKDFTSLYWFSMWGVWLGILTLIHVIVGVMGHCPDTWIPFSHVQERVGSLILAMWCVFPGQSKETKWLRFKKKFWIFLLFGVLFVFGVLFSSTTSLSAMKQGIINRPQEILPLCVACLVFGRLLNVTSALGKILRISVLNAGFGVLLMMFSDKLYDWQFNMAVGFKVVSCFFMLYAIIYLLKTVSKKTNGGCKVWDLLKGNF